MQLVVACDTLFAYAVIYLKLKPYSNTSITLSPFSNNVFIIS